MCIRDRVSTQSTGNTATANMVNVSSRASQMERKGVVAPYQTKPEKVVRRNGAPTKTVTTTKTVTRGPGGRTTTTTTRTTTAGMQKKLDDDVHRVRNVSAQAKKMERQGVVAPYQTKPVKVTRRTPAPAPAPAPVRRAAPAPAPAPARRPVARAVSGVSTTEIKSLFSKIGNGKAIYQSNVDDWLARVERPKDNPQRSAVKQRAKSTFMAMAGTANASSVSPGAWATWCHGEKQKMGEAGFRTWFNKYNK
eukprot:TRINITY_DN39013_c0_g1_i2.p1 TRINITY_DN39013_c0_g1~~TRINITY_DN39013_c0_g1_i2.p1  ORF type:complete len:250 (-),score=34.04 TRINITY_DN39013_c0_g1_i2:169-918(-)